MKCIHDAEKNGIRTELCSSGRGAKIRAYKDGKRVGSADLDTDRGAVVVGMIEVAPGARRAGVGTRLYEAAVRVGCRIGLEVTSDSMRSSYAEAFWRKQEAKGRAVCVPGRGKFYDEPSAKATGLPKPTESADGEPEWACERYKVRAPCKVSTLDGTRARQRKRRAR